MVATTLEKKIRKQKPPAITEKAWSSQFRSLFRTLGWEGYHTFFSKFSEHGFPDWCLINVTQRRMVFVELKGEKGKLSEHQEQWRDMIQKCGVEWYCWKPDDFDYAAKVLMKKPEVEKTTPTNPP